MLSLHKNWPYHYSIASGATAYRHLKFQGQILQTGGLTITTRPEIRLKLPVISENWLRISQTCGVDVACAAVVKANAYGMGLKGVANTLKTAGANLFFVANCQEGTDLRRCIGIGPKIFVLAGYSSDFCDDFKRAELIPCISDLTSLTEYFSDLPESDYALHVETGLNRLALDDTKAASLLANAQAHRPKLIMSHLACADDEGASLNELQLDRLQHCKLVKLFPDVPLSLSGTDGIFLGPSFRLDCVRPGIGLYCGGFGQTTKDCLSVSAGLISVKEVEASQSIGYGQTWTASRKTRIATISMGYADGLPRTSRSFYFFADGIACPVRGRVSMDIVTVDVTHLRRIPATFELIGENQSLKRLSESFGEIPNSVLTRFGACMDSHAF